MYRLIILNAARSMASASPYILNASPDIADVASCITLMLTVVVPRLIVIPNERDAIQHVYNIHAVQSRQGVFTLSIRNAIAPKPMIYAKNSLHSRLSYGVDRSSIGRPDARCNSTA